jgi:hypothetical protein
MSVENIKLNFPSNAFKTKGNISLNDFIKSIPLKTNRNRKTTILESRTKEIKEFLKKNKVTKQPYIIIKDLNDSFEKLLDNNSQIDSFFKKLIFYKDITNKNIVLINLFLIVSDKYSNYSFRNYNENLVYQNPIEIDRNKFLNKNNNNFKINTSNNDSKKLRIIQDILTEGTYINLSLPSLGVPSSYIDFIGDELIKLNDSSINKDTDLSKKLPLRKLNVGENISELLFSDSNYNINNNLNKDKKLIQNLINGISVTVGDIFYVKKSNNKKKDKVKPEFVIPYTKEFKQMTKSEVDKIQDLTQLVKHNNELLVSVMNGVFKFTSTDESEKVKQLDKKYYKEILASYLFYIINIVSSILIEYINKIDIILANIIDSKEKRFGLLNIEGAFKYTSLLKISTLKFKRILLNNFYQLFIPNKIGEEYYGMKLTETGTLIPEGLFINSNEYIYDNYPFTLSASNEIEVNIPTMKDFILLIKDKKDIYENGSLEFGGFAFDNNHMKESIKILSNYYRSFEKNDQFTLLVIDFIINYFKKNNFPYEIYENLLGGKKISIDSSLNVEKEKKKLESLLLDKFESNLEKSTNSYIKLINIKGKVKNSRNIDINKMINNQSLYEIYFKLYFSLSKMIQVMTEKSFLDSTFKNSLLKKYADIKRKYEMIISERNQK